MWHGVNFLLSSGQKLYLEGREIINMFTAAAAVLGCSAEGSDCGSNLMVRAFSIALMHSCGFMLSTYRKLFAT